MPDHRIVIVGAGPAGMQAAIALVEAGHRPVVIDEAIRSGGQIYRRPPSAFTRSAKAVYGFEAKRASRLHAAFDAILDRIDYLPQALIWNAEDRILHVSQYGATRRIAWSHLILATGAMDRIIPLRGWTLPGVYTLGGAQIALKAQALGIGRAVVFLGTGPLLYLVAHQYAKAGLAVAAVLDVATRRQGIRALPGLLRGGRTLLKGLFYMARLRVRGIPLLSGVVPLDIEAGPDQAVAGVRVRTAQGKERRYACDAVGLGYGLRSETQLADLLGLDFAYDPDRCQWLPDGDEDGRGSVRGTYLAGDGAGILGADAAELTGRRAALAALFDLGRTELAPEIATLGDRLAAMLPFRNALDQVAFPFPGDLACAVPDDVMICRCEGLTAGAIRGAVQETGETDINRIKAFTRLGMGRCQGRVCSAAAAALLSTAGADDSAAGRPRAQAPLKPVPLGIFLETAHDHP